MKGLLFCSGDCYPWFLNNLSLDIGPDASEREVGSAGESAQRSKARLERHQRTVERVVCSVQTVNYPKFDCRWPHFIQFFCFISGECSCREEYS